MRARLGLKIVAMLLAMALAPLGAAALLIDQMAEVAQNFASNQAARLHPPLEQAQAAYRELIATKKQLYAAVAARVAERAAAAADGDGLAELFAAQPELLAVAVTRDPANPTVTVARPAALPAPPANHRPLVVEAEAGAVHVALTFAADLALLARYQELGRVLGEARQVESMKSALPLSYKLTFLALLGGVVVIASVAGIALARRWTGRIDRLVAGTRKVAGGDLTTRVAVDGRDELAELGGAFNRMLEDLEQDRAQILYLQRMSAWQDVARRLAHEIKNPLTPIQLAVQELQASYQGDDERHRKRLADAAEIIGEEIAGLRRLVDAFRELGRLPKVEAAQLDLAQVIEDLRRDPELTDAIELAAPDAPVLIEGDRLLLRRVLSNLVENGLHAGRAAGRAGRVVIGWTADRATGRARITVDDEGAGVAPDDRERIFEPYFTRKDTGTGLGLAIAKKIALEHGGDLDVAVDPAPTGGARFVLDLPLAP